MEHIEKVEKLREHAKVSYEEAKAALEDNNWDLLDAMVQLEKEGKMYYEYSTEYSKRESKEEKQDQREAKSEKTKAAANSFFQEIKRLIKLANERNLIISKDHNQITSIPISIVILILLLAMPAIGLILFVAVVAYFFGVRYSVSKAHEEIKESNSHDQGQDYQEGDN